VLKIRFIPPPTKLLERNPRPLAACADIVIDMSRPRGQGPIRRRCFQGVGRYPGTLQTATAELA
jgi:hypothetical protein